MAWLYRQKGSANWWLGYRVNGKQVLRSTGHTDRRDAEKELVKVQTMFEHSRAGSLTEELYQALTGATLPKITLASELEDWLKECRATTAEKTLARYESFAGEFKTFLNATESGPALASVTPDDVRRYLNTKRTQTAASTANLARKTLSAIFIRAVKNHHLRQNPVSPIKPFKALKSEKAVARRGFTLDELAQIYGKAPDDFWRTLIVAGFYTGLRLGDLVCLRWNSIDLAAGRLVLTDDKTEKALKIPIARRLREILASARAQAGKLTKDAYIWPDHAARYQEKGSGVFSSEFYKRILAPCGLVTVRKKSHKATGNGHSGKRQGNELSFHSLRHSFVSSLRSTGSNQAVAKELAGHASDQVNQLYTHTEEKALTAAINALPEFVK